MSFFDSKANKEVTIMFMNENVRCGNCGGFLNRDDTLFDEQAEVFFCDNDCLDEWADDHFDDIMKQYKRMHIYAG
ncbi:hypothetical protein AOX59_03565 [Lentibacillus amyloliquefaciens]|uniref:TRASH domain-containing protein n=1 Tax=Lentibacillus amyloliquefaciens TaxID=1472767 RepID=A0A0U4FJ35_9BACI|nr:hypothetical protein AOX59_03565 [Lentibacillus amyloliquefaciens]